MIFKEDRLGGRVRVTVEEERVQILVVLVVLADNPVWQATPCILFVKPNFHKSYLT